MSVDWAKADLSPFAPSNTDRAKIEDGRPVPCRLCEEVYRVLTLTVRFCASCEQGYCQSAHGAWVGRRGSCIQCGPHQARSPHHAAVATPGQAVPVPFEVFLERLHDEFADAPMRHGEHVMEIQNWTQDHGDLPDTIPVFWRPGRDTFTWKTGDHNLRQFSVAEARKVYDVWRDYRAQRTPRTFITTTLGVQNSKPIIAIFRRFEHLMA